MAGWTLGDWIQKQFKEGETISYVLYRGESNFPQEGRTADETRAAQYYWQHIQETIRGFYLGGKSRFPGRAVPGVTFEEESGSAGIQFVPFRHPETI